jgi:CelD/BcsL family acetyltransferase involved in cellulose biosynthesis
MFVPESSAAKSTPSVSVIPAGELSDELVGRWSQLQLADPNLASAFFRPEFTQVVAASRGRVFVAVLEHAGGIAGFFPFQRNAWGIGAPVGGSMSDYHGLIAEPSLPLDPLRLLRGCGLRMWSFNHLVASQPAFAAYQEGHSTSPFLDLSRGFAEYRAEKSSAGSKVISQADRKTRKLAREVGALSFQFDEADPAALRRLIQWKSAQYRRTGAPDIFATRWKADLVERIATMRGPEFAGVLSTLRADGQLIAAHLGIRSRTALHWWFPAYDGDFGQFSPGLVLLMQLAANAEQSGVRTLDLGRGDDPYKMRLMSGSVPLAEGAVMRPGPLAMGWRLRGSIDDMVRRGPLADPARQTVRWVRRQRDERRAGRANAERA